MPECNYNKNAKRMTGLEAAEGLSVNNRSYIPGKPTIQEVLKMGEDHENE